MSNTEKAVAKSERVEAWMKGKPPMIDKGNYKISLIKFLNWHNEFSDIKDLRKAAIKQYPQLAKCGDEELRQIGILVQCRDSLSDIDQMKLAITVESLSKKNYEDEKPTKIVPIKRAIDRVELEATKIAEKIEIELDNYLLQRNTSEFDVSVYVDNAKLTAPVARKLGEYFVPVLQELESVVLGKDEQLNEGYAIPKPRIKRAIKTILVPLLDKLDILVRAKRAERKPRKKKEKPVGLITKSVKYLKEFSELKLTSVDPKKIIGASQVWLYNTKYKKLTVLIADSGAGLTIKGTTIYGFDINNSKTKVVRKPDIVLNDISKRKLDFHMKQMKTAEQSANGRINEDTLILAV